MTAKSARKSPSRLTTCAYHTRRITVDAEHVAERRGIPCAAAAVDMGKSIILRAGAARRCRRNRCCWRCALARPPAARWDQSVKR